MKISHKIDIKIWKLTLIISVNVIHINSVVFVKFINLLYLFVNQQVSSHPMPVKKVGIYILHTSKS